MPENPEAYALAVARNLVNRYYKNEMESQQAFAVLATNRGHAVKERRHASPVSVEQFEEIIAHLDVHFSPKVYEAIRLRFAEGLSSKEAAGRLGCSKAALKKRLQRAKRTLKKSLRSRR